MDRRHAIQSANLDSDIARRNDERRHQLQAEQQHLEEQLAADGWRKLMRDLLGKTRRDAEQLEATRLNLQDIQIRESAERQALQARQEAERQARSQDDQQRKQAYAQQLEQDRQEALKSAVQAEKPEPEPQPANDRLKPSWSRTEAPEQDNQTKSAQDFQKAAVGAPEPSISPEKQRAIDEHKQRMQQRLAKGRERGRDGYDYD